MCLAILLLARTPLHYENYISFKFQVERIYANISTGKIRKYWRKIIIKKLGDDKIANNIDDDVDDDDAYVMLLMVIAELHAPRLGGAP